MEVWINVAIIWLLLHYFQRGIECCLLLHLVFFNDNMPLMLQNFYSLSFLFSCLFFALQICVCDSTTEFCNFSLNFNYILISYIYIYSFNQK